VCILIWHKRIWLVESRHATSYYYEVCFSLDKQNLPEHVITHLNVERNLVLNYVITGVSWSNIFFASIVKYLTGQFVISSPTKKNIHASLCMQFAIFLLYNQSYPFMSNKYAHLQKLHNYQSLIEQHKVSCIYVSRYHQITYYEATCYYIASDT
jgi:hypothetical protein